MRSLTARGIPWCGLSMPDHAQNDIQVAGEYLVHAIRRIHRLSGRRVAVMGHSQGGMSMRWALRFWPDTRAMVDDVIGFAGSNHGTGSGGCPTAARRPVAAGSAVELHRRAEQPRRDPLGHLLHRGLHPPRRGRDPERRRQRQLVGARRRGPDHQRGDAGHLSREHQRALHHRDHRPGGLRTGHGRARPRRPASEARIDRAACAQTFAPGVDPTYLDTYLQIVSVVPGVAADVAPVNTIGVPVERQEPALRCYVFAECTPPAAARTPPAAA